MPQPGIEPEAIAWKATMLPLHHQGYGFISLLSSKNKKKLGPTEVRTRDTGFKVRGAHHYTMEP